MYFYRLSSPKNVLTNYLSRLVFRIRAEHCPTSSPSFRFEIGVFECIFNHLYTCLYLIIYINKNICTNMCSPRSTEYNNILYYLNSTVSYLYTVKTKKSKKYENVNSTDIIQFENRTTNTTETIYRLLHT